MSRGAGFQKLGLGLSAVASLSQDHAEPTGGRPRPLHGTPLLPHQSCFTQGGALKPGLGGKVVVFRAGFGLAVQHQPKPLTSLGLSFSTCEMNVPHRANQQRTCAERRLWKQELLGSGMTHPT